MVMSSSSSQKPLSSRDSFKAYTGQEEKDNFSYRRIKKEKKIEEKEKETSSPTNKDPLTGQIIITKEGEIEDVINIEDLRRKLTNLKAHSRTPIRKITGTVKEDFESLTQYVTWIYGTESYHLLYSEIKDFFKEDEKYEPGTIGAYCGGCLVKRKDGLLTRGCTVVCAGSAPPPFGDDNWDFCPNLVIWATYNGENYDFTTLNEVKETSQVIIYIDHDSLDTFPGFSEIEKKTLKDNGITQVRLIYYNPNGNPVHKEVSDGFIPLDQVKTRPNQAATTNVVEYQSCNWWWIIIIALIIIALFFILCRCSRGADW